MADPVTAGSNAAEGSRKLSQFALTTVNASTFQIKLPPDTVIRNLMITLSGSVVTTFASGTPVADSFSTMDNLFPNILIQARGKLYKSVRPWLMQMQLLLTQGLIGQRQASAGAAAAKGNYPTADGSFVYGTTTQITTVRESIVISFSHAYSVYGKDSTCADLRGVPDAVMQFQQNSFSSLLGFGNTAPVVYSSNTLAIDVVTNEWVNAPVMPFLIYRQTTRDETVSTTAAGKQFDLNYGTKFAGLMLLTRDGAAGSTTTATGKLPQNFCLTDMRLIADNYSTWKQTTQAILQADNRANFGYSSAFASNVSVADGVVFWNLVRNHDIRTALDTTKLRSLKLQVDTAATADISYTNPMTITIQQDEIAA